MPVKHNCQYDDVVGECNVSLAIVCKVIVPVLSCPLFLKTGTLPVLSAFVYVIDFVSAFYMAMRHP
jgi:hypothetical protein